MSGMKTEAELKTAIAAYADTVKRICCMYVRNTHDAEDIFQNVFTKYALYVGVFKNEEHEKAWVIRVTINCCKDYVKTYWKKNVELHGGAVDMLRQMPEEYSGVLQAVRELPPLYRDAVYLHYYEGYKAREIGRIMKKSENTVYSLLGRARERLKKKLGSELFGE